MGKGRKLVVIKLGGSLVTNKDMPLTPNIRNIRVACRELSKALSSIPELKLFLIHGGGSFGHYYARRFGLSTNRKRGAPVEGLSRTVSAMIELHSIILEELCKAGVYCATILPTELFRDAGQKSISKNGICRINSVFENGLVPITFGFVNLVRDSSFIVSGDTISLALARTYPIEKTIFLIDVDGVYPSSDLKGPIIRELLPSRSSIKSSIREYDVTGGMSAKISVGFKLSKMGSDVYFLNGSKPNRLLSILEGVNNAIATKIYSAKRAAFHSST